VEDEVISPFESVTVHVNTDVAEIPAVTVACTVVEDAVGVAITKLPAVAPVGVGDGVMVHKYVTEPDPPVTVLVYNALVCVDVDNKVGVGLFDSVMDTDTGR
jgi:hypothetical protein